MNEDYEVLIYKVDTYVADRAYVQFRSLKDGKVYEVSGEDIHFDADEWILNRLAELSKYSREKFRLITTEINHGKDMSYEVEGKQLHAGLQYPPSMRIVK